MKASSDAAMKRNQGKEIEILFSSGEEEEGNKHIAFHSAHTLDFQ